MMSPYTVASGATQRSVLSVGISFVLSVALGPSLIVDQREPGEASAVPEADSGTRLGVTSLLRPPDALVGTGILDRRDRRPQGIGVVRRHVARCTGAAAVRVVRAAGGVAPGAIAVIAIGTRRVRATDLQRDEVRDPHDLGASTA